MMDKWDGKAMPSQAGRIGIVTGANQGIGFACARQLAEHGMHVVLACRNEERAREAVQKIRHHLLTVENAGHVEYMIVDVGCMASVKSFADAVHSKFDHIDLLINNAGVGVPQETHCTDGYTIQFGVNYLGHFYLTNLLLDMMKKSQAARVVNVSSPAHRQQTSAMLCKSTKLDFSKLAMGEGDMGWSRYEKSKLCNLIFTYELDRRLKKAGIRNIKSIGSQPGVCYTNIFDQVIIGVAPKPFVGITKTMYSYALQNADMGSLPLLYAATETDVESAEYFGPKNWKHWFGYPCREISSEASHSEEYGLQLWLLSEELTKTPFNV